MLTRRFVPCTLLLLGLVLPACQSPPPAPPAGSAPTPYTAGQIRRANPVGTRLVFRVEQVGEPTVVRSMTFVAASESDAVIESVVEDENGEPIGEPTRVEATWYELRDHAAFPAVDTGRATALASVPAGRFQCWLYTVESMEADVRVRTRYYFAHTRPGPPVLLETEIDGALSMRMGLISDSRE